jgi:hypothetical protein
MCRDSGNATDRSSSHSSAAVAARDRSHAGIRGQHELPPAKVKCRFAAQVRLRRTMGALENPLHISIIIN